MGKKGVRGNIGADTDAIIRESDLIEFDGTFGQFAKLLKGTQKDIEDFMNALSNYAPKIRQNLQNMMQTGNMQLADSDKLRLAAQLIDQMYNAQMKLAASSTETAKTIALANEATSKNVQANKLWAEQTLAANGSIDQLNAKIKELTSQWTALSDAERQGAQGQQLIKQIANETLAIKRLNSAVRDEISTQMKLDSVTKQRNAAMSTEMKQVSAVRQELNALNRQRELEIKAANAADGSYEKLAASYELGKLKLKGMAHQTQDQINLFEAESQKLATLYKQMMDMQEATGKHTLSVGDYGKAFRSLSTETGMLVRELPALAVSANTFFLAISNNLPMFMSAVSRMKKENQALAAQGMATTSVFKTVMKSVLSWQTLVIVALSLLSKYGSKIVDWIKEIFNGTKKAVSELVKLKEEITKVNQEAQKSYQRTVTELESLKRRLGDVVQGSDEWQTIVARINQITKSNLDTIKATPEEIAKVTNAYIKQQKILAKNNAIYDRLAKSDIAQNIYASLIGHYGERPEALAASVFQKGSDEYDDLVGEIARSNHLYSMLRAVQVGNVKEAEKWMRDVKPEAFKYTHYVEAGAQGGYTETDYVLPRDLKAAEEALQKELEKQNQKIYETVSEELGLLTERQYAGLEREIEEIVLDATTGSGNRQKSPKSVDFDEFFERLARAKAMPIGGDEALNLIQQWLDRELKIEQVSYEKSEAQRKKYWKKQLDNLEYNYSNGLIKEEDYIAALGEEEIKGLTAAEKYAAWRKRIEDQMQLDLTALQQKHIADRQNKQNEAYVKEATFWKTYYSNTFGRIYEEIQNTTDLGYARGLTQILGENIEQLQSQYESFNRTAEGAKIYNELLASLMSTLQNANLVVAKLDIELTKTNTQLQKFGRANSELGQRRNLTIASSNVTKLSEAIAHLREEQNKLDKSSKEWLEYEKQINTYLQQIEQQVNRVDISRMISGDGDLITNLVNRTIDAADPAVLMQKLSDLKFGEVAKLYMKDVFAIAGDSDLYDAFEEALKNNDGNFSDAIESVLAEQTPEMQKKIKDALEQLGLKAGSDLSTIFKKVWSTVTTWFNQTIGYLKDLAQAYVDLAEAKAEAAAEATDAAQEEYDKEKALLEAGYANQVETKWAEYQEKKRIQEEAEADAKAAAARMEEIETAQQMMSLVTSIANIFEVMTKLGPWGTAAAAAMSGVMLASFIAAKSKAREAATVQYGEGHAELIGGGTHASGHDSPLAYDNQGRERRVERGEVVGIFKSRAVREIGASRLIRNIDNINRGRYTELATKAIDRGSNLNMLAQSVETSHADLSKLESGVNKIARQGEKRTYVDSVGNIIVETPYGKTTYAKR